LNEAAKQFRWGVLTLILLLVFGLTAPPLSLILWLPGIPLSVWLMLRDSAKRSVVLFYDVDDAPAAWFDGLVSTWPVIASSQKLWRTVQSGRVQTLQAHKTNAGASHLVSRALARADVGGPKHLKTNVAVPSINVGKASLYFLPDRVLVRDNKTYSDVSYAQLKVHAYEERFIESPGQVPNDSLQVGQTWQYVNKGGGPDKRFSNNPILPIMLYGHLDLTSPQGLDWRVQTSRADAAHVIGGILDQAPKVN
jgi:hypothetical protein